MSETLRGRLNLVDEAASIASAQLEQRCVFHYVDWEIGMSVSGSNGDTNPTPYVSMVFKGTNTDRSIRTYPVTFTLTQFNEFVQNVNRMQKALSSFS